MKNRIVTISTFAKQLGFVDATDKKFRQLIKSAKERELLKIVQGGFRGDSMHHPKLVVLNKPFEMLRFLEKVIFPTYIPVKEVNGYRLTIERTGVKRILRNGGFSTHEWWLCEDCGKRISVRHPYASKVDFSQQCKRGEMPVKCKCLTCFLELIEEFHGLD